MPTETTELDPRQRKTDEILASLARAVQNLSSLAMTLEEIPALRAQLEFQHKVLLDRVVIEAKALKQLMGDPMEAIPTLGPLLTKEEFLATARRKFPDKSESDLLAATDLAVTKGLRFREAT